MSARAHQVLAAIETAMVVERRHPRLFYDQARKDHDCRQLSLALDRYRSQRATVGGRQDRLDAEQPDATWLEERARRREERHAKRRQEQDAVRRLERAGMSSFALHREVVERYTRLSTVPASTPEPSRGHADSALPPIQQRLDDDPRWQERDRILRASLERMLELLDEAEGLGTVATTRQMLGAEKDKRILAEVGLSPMAVVEKLGRDIAGSPETVRRVRRKDGRSAKDGTLATDKPTPASGTVRRVVIEDGR